MSRQPLLSALDQIRAHLLDHRDLPEAVSITVSTQGAAVQVTRDADAAGALLGWAWSLSMVQVTAWRPLTSLYAIHITVRGRTGSGLAVEAYASITHRLGGPGGDLDPGGRVDLTLDELRATGGAS